MYRESDEMPLDEEKTDDKGVEGVVIVVLTEDSGISTCSGPTGDGTVSSGVVVDVATVPASLSDHELLPQTYSVLAAVSGWPSESLP